MIIDRGDAETTLAEFVHKMTTTSRGLEDRPLNLNSRQKRRHDPRRIDREIVVVFEPTEPSRRNSAVAGDFGR
jgi:hypothetical protein